MKQKILILLFGVLVVALLVGLNAASYVQKVKTPDVESSPNRSTFNPGSSGTQAIYSLMTETGRKVTRWRSPMDSLLTAKSRPAVFVMVGSIRDELKQKEIDSLLQWTREGGRLVLIDRQPDSRLTGAFENWGISLNYEPDPTFYKAKSDDRETMVGKTPAIKPIVPSLYTLNVNAVQPSIFAGSVVFSPLKAGEKRSYEPANDDDIYFTADQATSSGPVEVSFRSGPVVHLASQDKNLLVDMPYGEGSVVVLADPYLVSNAGITFADNAQLTINLLSSDGVTAFDEFHHGFGDDTNRFLNFFQGTPVVAMFAQALIIVGFILFSQSRRFARAVPIPEPDRLSKLEYIAAMAELQRRTNAYDLAIENIYGDFRRRACRLFGLDGTTAGTAEIAARISQNTGLNSTEIESVLFKCEEIIRGESTNGRETLRLTTYLRTLEKRLGISRASKTRTRR